MFDVSVRLQCITGARTIDQKTLADHASRRLRGAPHEVQRVLPFMYDHSAIEARHFEIDPLEAERRVDWLRTLNEATRSLAARCLEPLLLPDLDRSALIVVSSTHHGFPGLSRWLQHRFQLPARMLCLDLAGTGCAGGPHALHLADLLLRSGSRSVCVLCVDALGTLSQAAEWSPDQNMSEVVAHCLASDGAAAVLLRAGSHPGDAFTYSRARFATRLWPSSLDWNVFSANDQNRPYFSVSKEIRTELAGEVRALLDGVEEHPIVAHPGGAALMDAMLAAFPKLRPYLEVSLQELRAHGNFGSPSVLRVLDLMFHQKVRLGGVFSLLAFGPGKVSALLTYDGVR